MTEADAHIPEDLSAVRATVDAVVGDLGAEPEWRADVEGRFVCDVAIVWAAPVAHVAVVLDREPRMLTVYVVADLVAAEPAREALAIGTAVANYGLLPACFELGLEDGELRCRTVLPLADTAPSAQLVADLIAGSLETLDAYAAAFARIAGGADPRSAIAEAEAE